MKVSNISSPRSSRKAFTIIELLVAVGVTALMVSLMLTIVVNVLGGWNRSSGSLTSGNQARLVLDQIGRDLQSAIMKRDNNGWLVAGIQQDQNTANGSRGGSGVPDAQWVANKPSGTDTDTTSLLASYIVPPGGLSGTTVPSIDDYRFGQGGVWLRFFTTSPDSNNGDLHRISAPRAVAYQIVRLPVVQNSTEYRYQLFRSEVRPGHANATLAARSTFAVGYNLMDPANLYNVPNDTDNFGVLISSGVDQGGEPGSIRRPDRNQLIANNIIDFGVRFWVRNATTGVLEIAFPRTVADLSFAATSDTAAAVTSRGFPEVAEVFVRVLTDEGVTQIANLESGLTPDSSGKWWEIALANSRVYSRRVEIKANSL
jgi:type II secretory pathway pseudopilin PulG